MHPYRMIVVIDRAKAILLIYRFLNNLLVICRFISGLTSEVPD